jgi:hypothetical protein
MLFRFMVSSGGVDFWTNRNLKVTIGAFSSHFKSLSPDPLSSSLTLHLLRYSIAVLKELMQYGASSTPPPHQSRAK